MDREVTGAPQASGSARRTYPLANRGTSVPGCMMRDPILDIGYSLLDILRFRFSRGAVPHECGSKSSFTGRPT